MATNSQFSANRENSKFSTGPSTPEGKAASSRNAITHGFCAADPVLPHEDRAQFNALLDRYRADYAPATAHAETLVTEMAGARWKLDRAERMEKAYLAVFTHPDDPEGSDYHMAKALLDKNTAAAFARIARYRADLERTYHRCARELRALRKEQNEANSTKIADKKLEKLVKNMAAVPPPIDQEEPRLVPIDQTAHSNVKDDPKPRGGPHSQL